MFFKQSLIVAVYATAFVVSPLLSTKIIEIGPIRLMAGMLTAVMAYGLLDVANNAYGLAFAKGMALAAFFSRAIYWIAIVCILALPPKNDLLSQVFNEGFRIAIAGELALFISQYLISTNLFDWFKRRVGLGFWARYNLTNIPSEGLALLILVSLSVIGTGKPFWPIIWSGLALRVIINVGLTPLFSFLARWAALGLLIIPWNTNALEIGPFKLDGPLRVMGSTPPYTFRFEAIPTLRFDRFWANDLFIWDNASYVPQGTVKYTNLINNKLTVGVEALIGFSLIFQTQSVTGQPTQFRGGLEWRLP